MVRTLCFLSAKGMVQSGRELRAANMAKIKNYKIRAAVIFIICVLFISDAGGHVLDLGVSQEDSFEFQ